MKKSIIISALLFGFFGFAQQQSSDNVFNNSESNQTQQTSNQQYATNSAPTGPGDPVPVDGFLPVLMIAAAAIAIYTAKKKISLQ